VPSDITALAPWFGAARLISRHVGDELAGCRWVGVPFAGGMTELLYIDAPTIVVSDIHRHVINLARCVQDERLRPDLIRRLARLPFHPDCLSEAQERCKLWESSPSSERPCLSAATDYFVCCWMGRSGKAGIDDEFNGGLSIRWNANGGDSNTRYRSAIRSLVHWGRVMRRCNFSVMDCFDFIDRCEDADGHAIYCDPPFPEAGRRYRHNAGDTAEVEWHTRLWIKLARFFRTRVVCRFYDHPLIRELYPEPEWKWRRLKGRKQSNAEAPEVLVINGPSLAADTEGGLFS